MGIQDKLSRKQSKLKRKLLDYKIRISGNCSEVIRLKVTENKYSDENVSVICHNKVLALIHYPGEIPLYRLRNLNQPSISEPTGIYFYDILPIEVYTQFKDNVEKGDIIIRKIKDENGEFMFNVLRIADVLGAFKTDLIWRKCNAAPYDLILTQEMIDIIREV